MTQDAEVDMKDVELNEVDPEKQPMTGGDTGNGDANSPVTEKNGSVKVKIPDEKESKFTGLSKEELLRVAGTPGWIKVRWALLILFWLGWIGMLAGAIVIIVQAPRCKPLPEMNWWDYGPLYQIGDVESFTGDSSLKGLEKKLDYVNKLKVKGLVIGPIHASIPDKPQDLNLQEISSDSGTLEQLIKVLAEAHKKSISVVLDLTPNYKGSNPWFSNSSFGQVADKVVSATNYWLGEGVDGILLHGVEHIAAMDSFWTTIRETVKNHTQDEKKKALIGVTKSSSVADVSRQLNKTGVDLLLSGILKLDSVQETTEVVERLYSAQGNHITWNIGDRVRGHLASIVKSARVKLSQLLLLTLPGTAVFNYGDEIGLEDSEGNVYPKMLWLEALNDTEKEEKAQRTSLHSFFKSVSELKGKERSLMHGEYLLLNSSSNAMAYMRRWDQSERYIVALNWHPSESVTLQLSHSELPEKATVVITTAAKQLALDTTLNLAQLEVGPQEAVVLKFPYTA
ncbi:solute carrier family 3 member 2b [Salminus brasiliensis]|uniref:solute carrier family 3 member 2b n=1 Tax=Salminus brasiliensis TaxID=930266 RepID=UPI003B832FA1